MQKLLLTSTKTANAGFTLTEVMIAVLIFTFSLVALAKFAGNLFGMNNYAQQRTIALNYAQQKLADMQSFSNITAYNGYATGNDPLTTIGNTRYTRSWTVTSNTTIGYKTVAITVTWTTQDGSTKTLTLNSIIGRNDPAAAGQIITGPPVPTNLLTP